MLARDWCGCGSVLARTSVGFPLASVLQGLSACMAESSYILQVESDAIIWRGDVGADPLRELKGALQESIPRALTVAFSTAYSDGRASFTAVNTETQLPWCVESRACWMPRLSPVCSRCLFRQGLSTAGSTMPSNLQGCSHCAVAHAT